MIKQMNGAIFDLDGTILDSMHVWRDVGVNYLMEYGIKSTPDLEAALVPLTLKQSAKYILDRFELPKSSREIAGDLFRLIEHFYRDIIVPKKGAVDFLKALNKANVKMCVATATDRPLVEACLKRNDLLRYFDGIFTCSEVKADKERPDIYFHALNLLGTHIDDTYVFEDALYAIKTAKAAGFNVVAMYDLSSASHEEEIRSIADIYSMSFDELNLV